jgi:hypothetical protein
VGQEKLGTTNPDVIKAVGLFGGGVAGTGDVCGALLGGMACISSQCSRGTVDEPESPRMFKLGHLLDEAFTEITSPFGGKECSKIAEVDWLDRKQVEAFYSAPESRRKYCQDVVGETARALGELIDREDLS